MLVVIHGWNFRVPALRDYLLSGWTFTLQQSFASSTASRHSDCLIKRNCYSQFWALRDKLDLWCAGYKWVLVKEGEEPPAPNREPKPEDDPGSTAALDRYYSSSALGPLSTSGASEHLRDTVRTTCLLRLDLGVSSYSAMLHHPEFEELHYYRWHHD